MVDSIFEEEHKLLNENKDLFKKYNITEKYEDLNKMVDSILERGKEEGPPREVRRR